MFGYCLDKDKIFCKDYPINDMDWLLGKPIMNEFFNKLRFKA